MRFVRRRDGSATGGAATDTPVGVVVEIDRPIITPTVATGTDSADGIDASPAATAVPAVAAIDHLTAAFKIVAQSLRSAGLVGGWRDELYAVKAFTTTRLGAPTAAHNADIGGDFGAIERAVTTVLGMAQFGVHANIYNDPVAPPNELNFWLGQRTATKATWPSCWDTAVAGGLAYKEGVRECMVRECAEEASVPEALATANLRSASCVSFCCRFDSSDSSAQPVATATTGEQRERVLGTTTGLFFDNDFVFDLRVPAGFVPVPADGEVGKFEQVSANELLRRITHPATFPFLPSALLASVDMLVRLGYVTPDTHPDYFSVVRALRTTPAKLDLVGFVRRNGLSAPATVATTPGTNEN